MTNTTGEQIVCHVPEGREVGGRMLGADASIVVAEGHIHDPVEAVLDCPVAAGRAAAVAPSMPSERPYTL
jgi:hypothetical protein